MHESFFYTDNKHKIRSFAVHREDLNLSPTSESNSPLTGQCSGNLHGTWDNCLVRQAIGPDVDEAATALVDAITPEMKTRWSNSDPREWVNESFAISEAATTGYCEMHGSSCDLPNGNVTISAGIPR